MSQKWFNNIDLQQNELQNGVIQNLAADPTSGKAGQIYYNTVDKGYRYYNGTAWVSITAEAVKSITAGNGLTGGGTGAVTISLGTPSTSGSGSNTYGSNGTTAESHTHQINLPDASESAKGVIELATDAEAETGTDTTRAINAKQLAKAKQSAIDSAKVTIQTSNGITGGSATAGNSFTLSGVDASTEVKGVVQLAPDDDIISTDKAVTPKQLEAARKNAEVTVTAGNGLTGGGTGHSLPIAMGTPSTVNQASDNSVTATSHTHKLEFAVVNSPAAKDYEISFIDTVSQGVNGGISATKKTVRSASTSQTGVVQLATQEEVDGGTDKTKAVTPETLRKGKSSGVASLDANGKVIASQLPDYLLGQVMYGGNASTVATTTTVSPSDSLKAKKNITATSISIVNSATSTAANTYGWQDLEGVYFICQASGTFAEISFETGDWIISTGSKWEKIDNTDAVKSVNGKTGVVTLTASDVGALPSSTTYVTSVNGQSGAVTITKVDSATNATYATSAGSAAKADELNHFLSVGNGSNDSKLIVFNGSGSVGIDFNEGMFSSTVESGTAEDGSTTQLMDITLADSGVTAGTYNGITVDAKGRVTGAVEKVNSPLTIGSSPQNASTDNAYNGSTAVNLRFASPFTVTKSGTTTTVGIASAAQKYSTTITGNGSTTDFSISHGLGTSDVQTQVYLTGQTLGSKTVNELIMVDTYVESSSPYTIHLLFATAPTSSESFRVVVAG